MGTPTLETCSDPHLLWSVNPNHNYGAIFAPHHGAIAAVQGSLQIEPRETGVNEAAKSELELPQQANENPSARHHASVFHV